MKTWRPYDCACRCNEKEWVELCPLHKAEETALHERANAEHRQALATREALADDLAQ